MVLTKFGLKQKIVALSGETGADPESRNYGSSHFKRPFIRDETELEINNL
jgi:hypothetical protein